MSLGGPNPYQPPSNPPGNPYTTPSSGNPYVTPPAMPPQAPYVPPQPRPYRYPNGVPSQRPSLWRRLREDEWPPLGVVLRGGRERIHGCVWALVLMPCLWAFTLPLVAGYPMARHARRQARRLYPAQGRRRFDDREVARVQKARAWSAAVMSLLILVTYGSSTDMSQAQEQYWQRLVITPWLLLLTAPVVVGVLMFLAPPGARPGMRQRLGATGRSALWYFGAFSLVPVLGMGGAWLSGRHILENASPIVSLVLGQLLLVGGFLPMMWMVLFVAFATGPAVRSSFNLADVHEALPALLTVALVWEFMAISLVTGGSPPGPPAIQLCSILGGPASVTAVAWWEIHRLRTRHGVALRG